MYLRSWALSLLCFTFVGCTSEEPAQELAPSEPVEGESLAVVEESESPENHLPVEPAREAASGDGTGDAVDLALQFDGVGRSHRGYFRDPEIVRVVGESLVGVIAPPANVHVSAIGASGRITAVPAHGALTSPVIAEDGKIDLSVLTPITRSMAGYRELVSGKFDFRVQSFDVSVSIVSESNWCTFTATGQHPPTGEQLSQCLEVDGEAVCGVVTGEMLQLAPLDVERASSCFR